MVPSVREARERGALKAEPMFDRLTRTGVAWADGTTLDCDAILWCTGFRPALDHLAPLVPSAGKGRIALEGNRAVAEPRLSLLGYGDWTGAASATLIGAARAAKATVAQITRELRERGTTRSGVRCRVFSATGERAHRAGWRGRPPVYRWVRRSPGTPGPTAAVR